MLAHTDSVWSEGGNLLTQHTAARGSSAMSLYEANWFVLKNKPSKTLGDGDRSVAS